MYQPQCRRPNIPYRVVRDLGRGACDFERYADPATWTALTLKLVINDVVMNGGIGAPTGTDIPNVSFHGARGFDTLL
jgi:hypothetical protein